VGLVGGDALPKVPGTWVDVSGDALPKVPGTWVDVSGDALPKVPGTWVDVSGDALPKVPGTFSDFPKVVGTFSVCPPHAPCIPSRRTAPPAVAQKIRRFKDDRPRFIFDRMQVASGDTLPALA
jgi:hypothetical protein